MIRALQRQRQLRIGTDVYPPVASANLIGCRQRVLTCGWMTYGEGSALELPSLGPFHGFVESSSSLPLPRVKRQKVLGKLSTP